MTLARKTGEVKYVAAGPMVYPAGEYDPAATYTRTTLVVPMVLCDTLYYVLNKKGSFKGINPKTDYATNKAKATWIMMDQMKYAFIEMLMANFAKLASAVFHGNFMFSQQGANAAGAATNDYTKFGTDAFTPNLLLNFQEGTIDTKKGIFRGSLMQPFSFVSGAYMPSIGPSGASGVYNVDANSHLTIVQPSQEIIKNNGLSFILVVKVTGSASWTERFSLCFKNEGGTTWPSCMIANGVSTSGAIFNVSKSCVLSLMYVPKVVSLNGKIHRHADLCVLNYDSSFMSIEDWDSSRFSTPPPNSDIVKL